MGVFLRRVLGPPYEAETEAKLGQPVMKHVNDAAASIQRQADAADYLGQVSRMTIAATNPEALRRPQAVPVDDEFDRSMARMLGRLVS
jgi:hypothetical protein